METKLVRIAEISATTKHPIFTSVYHLINEDMLKQCHKELDGSKAVGIDKVTKDEYGKNLDRNIKDLVQRLKNKSFKPLPSLRVYIPKANGKKRPLGIASYEDKINIGGSDLEIPIVSYCDDVSDVHYNPYNTVEFYVGNITRTTPQTVKIYTDETTSVDITVSEGNKWYSYVLPKDKGLYKIEGVSVKKVAVKADFNISGDTIIPQSTIEASFKGSNTSKVTDMRYMFGVCSGLTSLDLSNFDTSKVTNMASMFNGCRGLTSLVLSNFKTNNVNNMNGMFANCIGLTFLDLSGWDMNNATTQSMFNTCTSLGTIRMKGCSQDTITKIKAQLKLDHLSEDIVKTE